MAVIESLRGWVIRRREAMDCRAAVELTTEYLEGALTPHQRHRFERHLGFCTACAAYLDQLRSTVDVLGRLQPEQLPTNVRAELVDLYRRYHADT